MANARTFGLRTLCAMNPFDTAEENSSLTDLFSIKEFENVIFTKGKGTLGYDNITYLMIINSPQSAKQTLDEIFNELSRKNHSPQLG